MAELVRDSSPSISRGTWGVAAFVLLSDVAFYAAVIWLNQAHHVGLPASGQINTSAPIGWVSVLAACLIFGSYGVLMKSPEVQRVSADAMVFQCYFSFMVGCVSFATWLVVGHGLTFSASSLCLGFLFACIWICQAMTSYNAVQILGFAVGPAIWIGVTICVSFFWGAVVFGNPVKSVGGSIIALVLLVTGVVVVAQSSALSSRMASAREVPRQSLTLELEAALDTSDPAQAGKETVAAPAAARFLIGIAWAMVSGIANGSLMVPMTCFQDGCSSIGVSAYKGQDIAPFAFMPSMTAGLLVAQPLLFLLYFSRDLARGNWPSLHFRALVMPGCLTGTFWGLGNVCNMFATAFLGQAIGIPLTQCCLILNGVWGILYYREISGALPLFLFAVGSFIVLAGAAMDGNFA